MPCRTQTPAPLRLPEFGRSEELLQNLPTATPTPIYELLGIVSSTDSTLLDLRDRLAAALTAYRQQRWSEAETGFPACFVLKSPRRPQRSRFGVIEPTSL